MDNRPSNVAAMQDEIARAGWFSVVWHDGKTWNVLASTDARWIDRRIREIAAPDAALSWVPAARAGGGAG